MTGPYSVVAHSFANSIYCYDIIDGEGRARAECDDEDAANEIVAALNERHARNTASGTADSARGILPSVWGDEK